MINFQRGRKEDIDERSCLGCHASQAVQKSSKQDGGKGLISSILMVREIRQTFRLCKCHFFATHESKIIKERKCNFKTFTPAVKAAFSAFFLFRSSFVLGKDRLVGLVVVFLFFSSPSQLLSARQFRALSPLRFSKRNTCASAASITTFPHFGGGGKLALFSGRSDKEGGKRGTAVR